MYHDLLPVIIAGGHGSGHHGSAGVIAGENYTSSQYYLYSNFLY